MYAPTPRPNVMMNVMNLRPSLEIDRALGSRPLISLHGVSRLYDGGAITALQNVDLQIDAGDCMAIVGASCSGKSSLVNMLCGIDHPSSGTLDSTSAANVAALMFRLCEDYGMTLVLVTHDEKLAARCPRQVRIKDGVIVEDTAIPDPLLELQGTA